MEKQFVPFNGNNLMVIRLRAKFFLQAQNIFTSNISAPDNFVTFPAAKSSAICASWSNNCTEKNEKAEEEEYFFATNIGFDKLFEN